MKTENQDNTTSISTLVNGTILKTALTNPSEVIVAILNQITVLGRLRQWRRRLFVFIFTQLAFCSSGSLSQTKTRQRRKFVKGPYVFNRSYSEYDQESRGLRRVPRHRYSEGEYIHCYDDDSDELRALYQIIRYGEWNRV